MFVSERWWELTKRNRKNLVGKKFGSLTVLSLETNLYGYDSKFLCRCDCGNETIVFGSNLKRGNTKSCGCQRKGRPREIAEGKVFNNYTVIKYIANGKYLCKCKCGEERTVLLYRLKHRNIKSCSKCRLIHGLPRIKLEGTKIGKWNVLEYSGNQEYLCRCDCGTIKNVRYGNLKQGKSKGCRKCSKGGRPYKTKKGR